MSDINNISSLSNPYKVINEFYEKSRDNLTNGVIVQHFRELLADNDVYSSIPLIESITDCDLHQGKLVRLRCMIQDVFEPQLYNVEYKIKNNQTNEIRYELAKYKDYTNIRENEEFILDYFNSNHQQQQCMDRNVLYCIPIPCQNKWVSKRNDSTTNSNNQVNKKKRPIEDDQQEDDDINNNNNNNNSEIIDNNNNNKKIKQNEKELKKNNNNFGKEIDFEKLYNYPVPANKEDKRVPFIVKVYDDYEIPQPGSDIPISVLKVSELVEFVGIVPQFVPDDHSSNAEKERNMMNMLGLLSFDSDQQTFPESLVPLFHCITFKLLNPYENGNHEFPFNSTTSTTTTPATQTEQQQKLDSIKSIRQELVDYILNYINDPLFAEYFIFYIISKVYSYNSGICLGNFSLNIDINCKDKEKQKQFKDIPKIIERILENVVCRSYRFEANIDNLNDFNIIPTKNYDENRIVSGLLQLAKNTHLIIDETTISEGKLESQALKGLAAIRNVSMLQKIEYDFIYHPIEFQTDIQIIDVSVGKPLVDCFSKVKINPTATTNINGTTTIDMDQNQSLFTRLQKYVNILQNTVFQPSDSQVTDHIQNDFVSSRQKDPNLSQEIFHYWLTLSRLMSLSFGENKISIARWESMKALENSRTSLL